MQIYRIIISDGRREYFEQTAKSVFGWHNPDPGYMQPDVQGTIISDDSQNPEFGEWLDSEFKGSEYIIRHHPAKLGMCAAVDDAWSCIPDCDYVQHLEEDFILERKINLEELAYVLQRAHWLSQIWIMRQPWYAAEREAGGIYQHRIPAYWGVRSINGPDGWPLYWTEYNGGRFWTQNPCLYPKWLVKRKLRYPLGPWCEEQMAQWTYDQGLKSAFWGRPDEQPHAKHIGVISGKTMY